MFRKAHSKCPGLGLFLFLLQSHPALAFIAGQAFILPKRLDLEFPIVSLR